MRRQKIIKQHGAKDHNKVQDEARALFESIYSNAELLGIQVDKQVNDDFQVINEIVEERTKSQAQLRPSQKPTESQSSLPKKNNFIINSKKEATPPPKTAEAKADKALVASSSVKKVTGTQPTPQKQREQRQPDPIMPREKAEDSPNKDKAGNPAAKVHKEDSEKAQVEAAGKQEVETKKPPIKEVDKSQKAEANPAKAQPPTKEPEPEKKIVEEPEFKPKDKPEEKKLEKAPEEPTKPASAEKQEKAQESPQVQRKDPFESVSARDLSTIESSRKPILDRHDGDWDRFCLCQR